MTDIFKNSKFITKLPRQDKECSYVHRLIEMPSFTLRDLNLQDDISESLHGVVPTNRLPTGYNYGIFNTIFKQQKDFEKNGTRVKIQNSNLRSNLKIQNIENNNTIKNQRDEYTKMINTVQGDILMSENDDNDQSVLTPNNTEYKEDPNKLLLDTLNACTKNLPNLISINVFQKLYTGNNQELLSYVNNESVQGDFLTSDDDDNDNSSLTSNNTEYIEDHGKLLFDTLNSCSQKLPNLNSINMFQKYYTGNNQELPPKTNDEIKKELKFNLSCETETVENESSENYQQRLKELMEILSRSSSKDLLKSFQPVYDLIKDRKRKLELPKVDEIDATNIKVLKLSNTLERKKDYALNIDNKIYFKNNDGDILMDIISEFSKNIDLEKFKNIFKINSECIKQKSSVESCTRSPGNSAKNDIKVSKDNSAGVSDPQQFLNNQSKYQVKNPEAAAKQFYLQSTHLEIDNNPNIAMVPANNNKSLEFTNMECNLSTNSLETIHNHSASQISQSCTNNGNDAMRKMRIKFKSDFIERMNNLDLTECLTEVRSLKEKAISCKRELDYAPQIMEYIRKRLIYNYSLEVKAEYGKSRNTYLENTKMIKQYCYEITQTYNEHEANITDISSARLWNIKLVKHFTVVMCHRLRAVLQFRALRNLLGENGIIERNDRLNQVTLTESHQLNHGQISSTHNSSPRLCTSENSSNSALMSSNNVTTNLTQDMKLKLQKYMDQTTIINTAYSDWVKAEIYLQKFCSRSSKHNKSWMNLDWKIIENCGGIVIESINESVPFVIKYLEGYINYIKEFMKQNL